LVVSPLAFAAGCFGDKIPTTRVGGTQYWMMFSVPSPVRLPSATFTTRSRTVAGAPIVDSLNVVLSTLRPLAAPARYQLFLVDGKDSTARAVSSRIRITRTDSALAATGITTSTTITDLGVQKFYAGAPFNTVANVTVGVGDTIGSTSTFLVVTIQDDSTRSTYGADTPKPLWFRFRDVRTLASTTDDVLTASGSGAFGLFFEKAAPRVFAANGNGRSGFWDVNADGRLIFQGLAFGLTQPPAGYYYQPYARDGQTGRAVAFGVLTDTLGASLMDADKRPVAAQVAQLPNAKFGTTEDTVGGRFTDFTLVQLVLEPKRADLTVAGISAMLQGQIPDTLAVRRARGSVTVTVLRGGTPVSGATVNVLAAGTNIVLGNKATDATGKVVIDLIPAGLVDIRAFPAAGTTAGSVAQTGVTVTKGTAANVSLTLP
jgi:hypothetical protein